MVLELNEREIEALRVLIESRIAAIGPEIHHTQTFDYREFLKTHREVLQGVLDRMTQPVG